MTENKDKDEKKEVKKAKEEKPEDFGEIFKAILIAGVIALCIRSFAFEPFNIPSGSMLPTLKVGDYLFVSKYSYGYSKYSLPFGLIDFDGRIMSSEPERGDVIVFRQPKKVGIDYIKRLIGLPGDKIQVKSGVLHINGEPVVRERVGTDTDDELGVLVLYTEYIETLPNGVKHSIYEISDEERFDNTPEYQVPEGYFFMMGDNRDGSLDSRATNDVGMVPEENFIGKAQFLFYSKEPTGEDCKKEGFLKYPRTAFCTVLSWPMDIRYSRIFDGIK